MKYECNYLVEIQFLGFRFHGWQKQPELKTVHLMVDKTLRFILNGVRFKSLGVGRTDARVSANFFAFQLFIDEKQDFNTFIELFNTNSPGDVRAMSIKKVNDDFNIMNNAKEKEYRYYFSHSQKNHPYSAPFITGYVHELDINLMKSAAELFIGEHDFTRYCTKPSPETQVVREIISCTIETNTYLKANFFPEESFVLRIKGKGFLRNQIRLIMGALSDIGSGKIDLNYIKESLKADSNIDVVRTIAPASGLHLHHIDFD
jgi:tRNA pseudouridine38-40 synthase